MTLSVVARLRRTLTSSLPPWAAVGVRHVDDGSIEVSEAEMAQLHPRAVDDRRAAFRAGRAAGHDALASMGCDDGPILVGLQREPVWPMGVVGSISHAWGVGVALVAPAGSTDGVGIDVEAIRPAPELYDQVPRPEERSWLDAIVDVRERDAAVLELFSAKESIFKAFFPRVGELFGFEAASLVRSPSGFIGALVMPIDAEYPPDRSFEVTCLRNDDLVVTWLILPSPPRGPSAPRDQERGRHSP